MSDRTISDNQRLWLGTQTRIWESEGLITAEAGERIRGRYVVAQQVNLTRLVVFLGAAFVAVGLIWLVAANLQRFSLGGRFAVVVLVWLALMVGTEVLRARSGGADTVWVSALRVIAAGAFGAVVFQAANSLNAPTDRAILLGAWAGGALVLAYGVRSFPVLVVAVPLTLAWVFWQTLEAQETQFNAGLGAALAGVVGAGVAGAHARLWPIGALPWREFGAMGSLLAVFITGIPSGGRSVSFGGPVIAVVIAAVLVCGVLAIRADRATRVHALVAFGALALGLLLSRWQAQFGFLDVDSRLTGATTSAILRASVAVLGFLLLATGVAVIGVLRESPRLAFAATAALVLFVTVQAFAVFAPILSGATLFLVLGVVLLATGYAAERGRRRLQARRESLA